jgi:hypothetical protein
VPARRLASLDPEPTRSSRSRALGILRRGVLAAVSIGGLILAWLALQKIGIGHIASALLASSPSLVLLGLAVMCSAMMMRAVS